MAAGKTRGRVYRRHQGWIIPINIVCPFIVVLDNSLLKLSAYDAMTDSTVGIAMCQNMAEIDGCRMSAYGYKRTLFEGAIYVRFPP